MQQQPSSRAVSGRGAVEQTHTQMARRRARAVFPGEMAPRRAHRLALSWHPSGKMARSPTTDAPGTSSGTHAKLEGAGQLRAGTAALALTRGQRQMSAGIAGIFGGAFAARSELENAGKPAHQGHLSAGQGSPPAPLLPVRLAATINSSVLAVCVAVGLARRAEWPLTIRIGRCWPSQPPPLRIDLNLLSLCCRQTRLAGQCGFHL